MSRACIRAAVLLLLACGLAHADGDEEPGQFDYWLLALTWSPQFCAQHAAEPQCLRSTTSFVVHGLWPEYEDGYPDYCGGGRKVDRALAERMLPLMPSEKLITEQWRKHGTCSGLDPDEYFRTVERAHRAVAIPAEYVGPEQFLKTSGTEIAGKFIAANPGLAREAIALECSGRWFKEARICFDRDFRFRACGEDIDDDCGDEVMIRPKRLVR